MSFRPCASSGAPRRRERGQLGRALGLGERPEALRKVGEPGEIPLGVAGERCVAVSRGEGRGKAPLQTEERRREAKRLRGGGRFRREARRPLRASLERVGGARRQDLGSSRPISSRYHFGWWILAQAFETVPRVIELSVPGSATEAR